MTDEHEDDNGALDDGQYRALLDLFMVSDPWPLEDGQGDVYRLLNNEAKARGYDGWVEAYHEHESGDDAARANGVELDDDLRESYDAGELTAEQVEAVQRDRNASETPTHDGDEETKLDDEAVEADGQEIPVDLAFRLGRIEDNVQHLLTENDICSCGHREQCDDCPDWKSRLASIEEEIHDMGRWHETSDGRPPVDAAERLDEIDKAASEARADTKDGGTVETLVSRVERLEQAVADLAGHQFDVHKATREIENMTTEQSFTESYNEVAEDDPFDTGGYKSDDDVVLFEDAMLEIESATMEIEGPEDSRLTPPGDLTYGVSFDIEPSEEMLRWLDGLENGGPQTRETLRKLHDRFTTTECTVEDAVNDLRIVVGDLGSASSAAGTRDEIRRIANELESVLEGVAEEDGDD